MLKFLITAKVVPSFDRELTLTTSASALRQVDSIDVANVLSFLDWRPVAACYTLSVASIGSPEDRGALESLTDLSIDEVIQLSISRRLDCLAKAKLLRSLILSQSFCLVVLGAQSSDVGSAQVGPALAGLLNWTCVTNVTSICYISKSIVTVQRTVGNLIINVRVPLPCVLSCNLNSNESRLTSPLYSSSVEVKPITVKVVNEANHELLSQIEVIKEIPISNIRLGATFSTLNSTLEAFSRWLGKHNR
ncbi:MAG: hypothetical protein ACTS4V_01095 [Candidatus Hodgkinia cicadicola]